VEKRKGDGKVNRLRFRTAENVVWRAVRWGMKKKGKERDGGRKKGGQSEKRNFGLTTMKKGVAEEHQQQGVAR